MVARSLVLRRLTRLCVVLALVAGPALPPLAAQAATPAPAATPAAPSSLTITHPVVPVDPDDPRFLPPGNMPALIAEVCQEGGRRAPTSRAEIVRCVLDSLALAYRSALYDAQRLSGRDVDVVHIVGGGSQNALLCQLTADACDLPVVAGPVEAAAIGNVLVQAQAARVLDNDAATARALVAATSRLRHYSPRGNASQWKAAAATIARH